MNSPTTPTFITRLTWNDSEWRRPAKHMLTEQTRYIRKHGFGFEEWLNRSEWTIEGYRYAFIQGVYKSRARLEGQRVDLMLYSVSPAGERVFVGVLHGAKVLDNDESERAMREFRRRGWLKKMEAEAAEIGARTTPFKRGPSEAIDWFNVGFRPAALELFHPPRRERLRGDLKDHVDLSVWDARNRAAYLVEVKSEPVPRLAVRNALGQLLEYAFFPGIRRGAPKRLVIVAPTTADAGCLKYLDRLRKQFGLKLHYRRYEPGSMSFTL